MPIDRYPAQGGPADSPMAKPFVIELHQADKSKSGSFRPVAFLRLDESFRTGGLLSALPAEELKTLMFLLTFVSPNGDCSAALHQLCSAMRLSALKVRRRMGRLLSFHWAGAQLVVEHCRESGLTVYTPHPAILRHEVHEADEAEQQPIAVAHRDRVIGHSRRTYTMPRVEVEKRILDDLYRYRSPEAIAKLQPPLNTNSPETTAEDSLQIKLVQVGLTAEQASHVIRTYDRLRIERQLRWLPYRNAKSPAGFLLAAISDDYEAPLSMRRLQSPAQPVADGNTPNMPTD